MSIFYSGKRMLLIYLAVITLGLGAAIWLLIRENKQSAQQNHAPNLLDRLNLKPDKPKPADPEIPSQNAVPANQPEVNSIIQTREKNLPPEPVVQENISVELVSDPELQAKCERLETLLTEKGEELEKKERVLANEIKTRKDFNKVKDILEKELKDVKDKNHKLQLELSAAKADLEQYQKRLHQHEEKIQAKEAELRLKEQLVSELDKRMQEITKAHAIATPASPSAVPHEKTPAPQPMPPAQEPSPDIPKKQDDAPEKLDDIKKPETQSIPPDKTSVLQLDIPQNPELTKETGNG